MNHIRTIDSGIHHSFSIYFKSSDIASTHRTVLTSRNSGCARITFHQAWSPIKIPQKDWIAHEPSKYLVKRFELRFIRCDAYYEHENKNKMALM